MDNITKGNLPTGVVIICVFAFGVAFTLWCYFVVKGASATVLGVAARGKVREISVGVKSKIPPRLEGKGGAGF